MKTIGILAIVIGILTIAFYYFNSNPAKRRGVDGPPAEVQKTDAEWRAMLDKEQYYVTREHGTEHAFSGKYWDSKLDGTYKCICCELPLFESETKYRSGTGWPSFWQPIDDAIETSEDRSLLSVRTEVHCRRCLAHLGHVFPDGPEPTGMRYCINSASLDFDAMASAEPSPETKEPEPLPANQ